MILEVVAYSLLVFGAFYVTLKVGLKIASWLETRKEQKSRAL